MAQVLPDALMLAGLLSAALGVMSWLRVTVRHRSPLLCCPLLDRATVKHGHLRARNAMSSVRCNVMSQVIYGGDRTQACAISLACMVIT